MSNVTNFQHQKNSELTSLVSDTWGHLLDSYASLATHAGTGEIPPIWHRHLSPLSREDIDRGWPRMEKAHPSFHPTPMEFSSLCKVRPEDNGYPSSEEAYQQAIGNRSNKHTIVTLTCREMGSRATDIRQMADNQARKIFKGFYLEVVDKVGKGHLKVPRVVIEDADAVRHTSIELINIQAEYVKKIMGLFDER
mgnify:CR=1 FL=1|jgi:hypothetical protein